MIVLPVPRQRHYETEWTWWDRFEMEAIQPGKDNREMILQEFIDFFQNEHELVINMLSQGCLLYSFFM
jgi:ubiquitin-activating enzyme E1